MCSFSHKFTLQVNYNSASVSGTASQSLTDGRTISVPGITPGSVVSLTVTITNSVGNMSYTPPNYRLCEATPGVVQSLNASQVTASTITLQWNAPAVTNGVISGYAISQDDTQVC